MITPTANYVRKGRVTRVIDGDTIDFSIDFGFNISQIHRIRLLRIDTPELNSPDETIRAQALAAKEVLIKEVMFKELILETVKSDSFGRYLAEVYYTGLDEVPHNLSDELLAKGFATPFKPRQIERDQLPDCKPEPLSDKVG